ncbi:MAG: hypothetical protein ABH837_00850 [bacterium]
MQYNVYPLSDEYEKQIWEIFKVFWRNPELFSGLIASLNPILERLFQENPNLNSEVDQELIKIGRDTDSGITKTIWTFLVYADTIYDQIKVDFPFDSHKVRKQVFDTLQQLLGDLNEFTDLVLALWLLKHQKGFVSFAQYCNSMNEYWDELNKAYPEFSGPGASVSRRVKAKIGKPPEVPTSTNTSKSTRRRTVRKKEKVGVH